MNGKGDKPRPMAVNRATFNENFDRIFNKPKGENMNEEAIENEIQEKGLTAPRLTPERSRRKIITSSLVAN